MSQYIKRSPITGRKYDFFSKDVLHLVNLEQINYYISEKGIVPLDVMLSDDRKRPGKKIVIFCFSREETKEAYADWCNRKSLEINELE